MSTNDYLLSGQLALEIALDYINTNPEILPETTIELEAITSASNTATFEDIRHGE